MAPSVSGYCPLPGREGDAVEFRPTSQRLLGSVRQYHMWFPKMEITWPHRAEAHYYRISIGKLKKPAGRKSWSERVSHLSDVTQQILKVS